MSSAREALLTTADPAAATTVDSGFVGAYGLYSVMQNDVLTQAYSDVFLIGGIASLAGMVLAFLLPGRKRE